MEKLRKWYMFYLAFLLLPFTLANLEHREYYVKPTNPRNTTCPGQPCMTLNQYMHNSARYLHSHSSLKFLPGSHKMDQPLIVQGIKNVSFAMIELTHDTSPARIEFECHCCPVQNNLISFIGCTMFEFHNSSHVSFHNLEFVRNCNQTYTCSVAVLNFMNVSYARITNIEFHLKRAPVSFQGVTHAVVVSRSDHIDVDHITTFLITHQVRILNSNNIKIEQLSIITGSYIPLTCHTDDIHSAVFVKKSKNIVIKNCSIVQPICRGVLLYSSYNTTVSNLDISGVNNAGIFVYLCNNTKISNIKIIYSERHGLHLLNTWNTSIIHVTLHHVPGRVIYLEKTFNTTITFISVKNSEGGLFIVGANHTKAVNISLIDSMANHLVKSFNTQVININMAYSYSIRIRDCNLVHFTNFSFYGTYRGGRFSAPTLEIFTSQNVSLCQVNSSSAHIQIHDSSMACNDCLFSELTFYSSETSVDVLHLPAVFELYNSDINFINSRFYDNQLSALKTVSSRITLSGVVKFERNTALKGAAMIIINSTMVLTSNSTLVYKDNSAEITGGAIEIRDTPTFIYDSNSIELCSIGIFNFQRSAKIEFVNNSASNGGDNIFGGSLGHFCSMNSLREKINFFTLYNMMKEDGQISFSSIASDPSRVCLCNDMGTPQCTVVFDESGYSLYPGQTLSLSAVVVGQLFGTVSGFLFAQFLPNTLTDGEVRLAPLQDTQAITQHQCNYLNFTIYSLPQKGSVVLALTAVNQKLSVVVSKRVISEALREYGDFTRKKKGFPRDLLQFPVFVTIIVLPCPPGFSVSAEPHKCHCSPHLQSLNGIFCDIQTQTFYRSGLIWVGPLRNESNMLMDVLAGSWCPRNYCSNKHLSVNLDNPDIQCSYNHSGVLCGGCQHGLSLALGSTQCLHCSNNYLALLIPFAISGITLVCFLKFLRLTISDGLLNGLVLYANVIKANEDIFLPEKHLQVSPVDIFVSWFNLDLGIETCFFEGLNTIKKTWLQFVFPLYVWLIAGLIIFLAKCNYRAARIMGNNPVPVLATLFLLSYAKFINTVITALSYSILVSENHTVLVWSADGNIQYLDSTHAPLFAAALFTLIFLSLPYTFLLLLGPFLTRCRFQLVIRMLLKLKPFLDAHYGPNKDKHRYWFGLLLLVRVAIMLVSALVSNNPSTVVLIVSVVAMILTMFSAIGVYCKSAVSLFEASIFLNLTLLCVTKLYTLTSGDGEIIIGSYLLIGLVMIQFFGLVAYKMIIILKPYFSKKTNEETETMWRFERSASLRNIIQCAPSEGSGTCPGAEYCQLQERAL